MYEGDLARSVSEQAFGQAVTLGPILAETGTWRPMSWELLKKACWI